MLSFIHLAQGRLASVLYPTTFYSTTTPTRNFLQIFIKIKISSDQEKKKKLDEYKTNWIWLKCNSLFGLFFWTQSCKCTHSLNRHIFKFAKFELISFYLNSNTTNKSFHAISDRWQMHLRTKFSYPKFAVSQTVHCKSPPKIETTLTQIN